MLANNPFARSSTEVKFFMENACCHPAKLSNWNAATHWYSRRRGKRITTDIRKTSTSATNVPRTSTTRRSGRSSISHTKKTAAMGTSMNVSFA